MESVPSCIKFNTSTVAASCVTLNTPKPTSQLFQRMLFPVHVYIHYTDTHSYVDRMLQIKRKLTEEPFFSFPVTCTIVLATGVENESGLFDVYVIGGHKRYKLGIVNEDHRPPTVVEVMDTIAWAAVRHSGPSLSHRPSSSGRLRSCVTSDTGNGFNMDFVSKDEVDQILLKDCDLMSMQLT